MLLKRAMSLAAFMVLVLSLPASTLAADGDLDPTFGTGGLVNTDFATSFDEARGLAIQADGKIVTAGLVFVGAPGDFGLAGYLNGAAICGNGNVEPGETCDDGNNANGDGCSPACLVEPGFTCSGEPSSCTLLIAQCQLAKLTADDATSCDRCGDAFGISVSMTPGQLFMTILMPFHGEDLAGSEPLSVDLTYYNRSTGSWELAVGGNDQPSPEHGLDVIGDRFAVVGGTIPVLSDELGDYGVFWNPDLQEGFVWANVDYTGEFANAPAPSRDYPHRLRMEPDRSDAVGVYCGDDSVRTPTGQRGRLRSCWDYRIRVKS